MIGFDCEAIQKRQSVRIGLPAAMSADPTASRLRTLSFEATSVTAPARVWLSTNGWRAPATLLGDSAAGASARARVGAA